LRGELRQLLRDGDEPACAEAATEQARHCPLVRSYGSDHCAACEHNRRLAEPPPYAAWLFEMRARLRVGQPAESLALGWHDWANLVLLEDVLAEERRAQSRSL
jgi:hypothetical protein